MMSMMQRAATFLSGRNGARPAPKTMESRLEKLVAKRRAEAVEQALGSLSDNRAEICSRPLYDESVYHSSDLWVETIPFEEQAEDRP